MWNFYNNKFFQGFFLTIVNHIQSYVTNIQEEHSTHGNIIVKGPSQFEAGDIERNQHEQITSSSEEQTTSSSEEQTTPANITCEQALDATDQNEQGFQGSPLTPQGSNAMSIMLCGNNS